MQLTRVSVGDAAVLVPETWTEWTYQGTRFERRHGVLWQLSGDGWIEPETRHESVYPRLAEYVELPVFDGENCGSLVGARRAPESTRRTPEHARGRRPAGHA